MIKVDLVFQNTNNLSTFRRTKHLLFMYIKKKMTKTDFHVTYYESSLENLKTFTNLLKKKIK